MANEALQQRIAHLMQIQRQLSNARGALVGALKRRDYELARTITMEVPRLDSEREAAILSLGEAAGEVQS